VNLRKDHYHDLQHQSPHSYLGWLPKQPAGEADISLLTMFLYI